MWVSEINICMIPHNIVIFGYPRSGTKLLADVMVQNGYHNFGEFFDTWSSELGRDNTAIRLPIPQQDIIKENFHKDQTIARFNHFNVGMDRIQRFALADKQQPNTVTVWFNNFTAVPDLVNALHGRFFMCTRRINRLDQLLSKSITDQLHNYNNEIKSTPVTVDLGLFNFYYFQLIQVERMQQAIVDRHQGVIVDFDQLIQNKASLGFKYKVRSVDQHTNLSDLITNLPDVIARFNYLENTGLNAPLGV